MSTKQQFRRGAWLVFLLVLLGVQLGGLAAFAWFDNEANRGITFTPEPTPIPWADGPQVGVNAYNIQFEPEERNITRTLEMAREMGARYVRMQMPWEDVEIHGKGDFEDRRNPERIRSAWEKYDFIFSETARLGLEPIVRIDRTPAWAQPVARATPEFQQGVALKGSLLTGPPDNYANYADFVAAAAGRYKGKVRFFQLWNEPNLAYEWNWQRPNPQQFVDLLRLASTAARAANPDAVILFPSLAPTDGLDPSAPFSDLEYLDAVYKAGGAAYFDIMSAQAYGLGQPPEEHRYVRVREDRNWRRPLDTRIDVSRLPLLREVMERHGDNGKAVWISEFGYVSASDTIPPERRNAWGVPVSEDQKAEYIVGQIERARREWPWVGVMNVWLLRWGGYQEADPADPTPNFALVDREFNPLPAYTKLKAFLANPAIAGVGAHSWEHPALQQGSDGMTLLRFEGTTLSLVGAGEVRINLAGGEQQRVTLAETPQVVLRGLADNTVHTVAIDAKGAQPTAFVVSRTQSNAWVWTLVPAVLLLTLACTGAMIARNLWITRG